MSFPEEQEEWYEVGNKHWLNHFFIVMKKVEEPFSRVSATVTNPNQRSRHIEECLFEGNWSAWSQLKILERQHIFETRESGKVKV
jgi:hypothetical protein